MTRLTFFSVLAFVLLSLPAYCQPPEVPLYTNADLGRHLPRVSRPSPEVLAGIRARQYQPSLPLPDGPLVVRTASQEPTAGPWTWPEPQPARRLDGTLLSDPPAVYGWPPFYTSFFVPIDRSHEPRRPSPKEE